MPAEPALMPGCAAQVYANSGTFAVPVWTSIPIVRDVEPNNGWDFAEARSRETPIKLQAKVGVAVEARVVIRADPADTDFAAWVEASGDRTATLDLLVLNATVSTVGACGFRGPFLIHNPEAAQEIDGIIFNTFEIKPTMDAAGNVAEWALVGETDNSPVVAFTDITY